MPETMQSLCQDAVEQIKVYAPGVTIRAADLARNMTVCNDMLDQWSNFPYACFANLEQSFPLVPAKIAYTIGTSGGADIVAPRPLTIRKGPGAAYLVDVNNNRFGINVVEQDQWNQIGLLTNTSNLPDTLFYDPQFPLGIININPTPLLAYNVYFDARLQLANLGNATTAVSLPPGYAAAIKDNLAIKLWKYYKQGSPPQDMRDDAKESLATIKRTNIKQSPSSYDTAVVSRAQSGYNIYTDNSNRGNG